MDTFFQNVYGPPSDLDDPSLSDGFKSIFLHSGFNPYQDNGGLSIAISGNNYVVLAGNTRQVKDYSIQSRYQPKVFDIGDGLIVSTCGFSGDSNEVIRVLRKRLMLYHHKHNRQLSVKSAARLIQTILYSRRFFPYYTYVMVVGMDEEGAIYTFDPVGSYERVSYNAIGSSASLALPLLDSQVGRKNQYETVDGHLQSCIPTPLSLEQAVKMIIDTYTSVSERHIQIGDKFQVFIETKNGIHIQEYPLRRD
ncbi:hypothetical protein PMAC_000288 [Pneumocystis sp. 'macacae']|nr:hypothetical protein PMAC_000288 [Pneumocystis sp. 'macacae']